MKNTLTKLAGAFLFTVATLTTASAGSVDLPQYGFSIDALDGKPSSTQPTTALMTFLPAADGFAPNVNVNIQPYEGDIKGYADLSKQQFAPMNWTVIKDEQKGDNEWVVEYKGPMEGNDLHFYARAVLVSGKVYLVTAAAKDSQWATYGAQLSKVVDSFKTK